MGRRFSGALALVALTAAGLATSPMRGVDATTHDQPTIASEVNPFAHDPEASVSGLARKGEALGWHIPSGAPHPTQCKHWQGIARSTGYGTPYLFVTRNSNADFYCGTGAGDDVSGDLSIVRLASREHYGERLRSNRLKKDTDIVDTAPPTSDRVAGWVRFDGTTPAWDDRAWPAYAHPGGVQVVGDVLAVALEHRLAANTPHNAVAFLDVADPVHPRLLSVLDAGSAGDHVPGVTDDHWGAGLVGITALEDGRYLLVVSGKDNSLLRFFVSQGTDLRSPTLQWDHWRDVTESEIEAQITPDWPSGDKTGDAHQSLNFVRTSADDALGIWLVGGRNTQPSSLGGEDWIDCYQLNVDIPSKTLFFMHRASRHIDTHATLTDGTAGSGNIASFKAASGTHVTPTGEIVVYGTEHDNTGPEVNGTQTVNFGEWRFSRMTRDDSPTFDPTPFANGPYAVPEGGSVQLWGNAEPPRTKAWVELYADPNFGSRSAVIDWPDFALDSWDDFDQLDGETTDHDNFSDDASSVRWYAPAGCAIRLNDDDYGDSDFPGDVVVRLPSGPNPQQIAHLGAADGAITSVSFLQLDDDGHLVPGCDRYYDAPLSLEWDLDRDGSFESVTPNPAFSAAALDGPTSVAVPLRAVHPMDGRAGHTAASVTVSNVAPTITSIGASEAIAVLGMPVTIEATFTDPGVGDTQTATIDWDDGTVTPSADFDAFDDASGGATGALSHAHAFTTPGFHDVVVEVTDDDGGTAAATLEVQVMTIEEALELVVDGIDGELASTTGAARRALLRARDAITGQASGRGEDGALDQLEDGNRVAAMVKLGEAVDALVDAEAAGADVADELDVVAFVADAIARQAYADAVAAADPPSPQEEQQLEEIAALIDAGEDALADGDHATALDHFTAAVRRAVAVCSCP